MSADDFPNFFVANSCHAVFGLLLPSCLSELWPIPSRTLGRRAFEGDPTPWKSSVVARVAMTERERAYRCDFMCQFRERRMPDMFLELSFSRGVHFHTISLVESLVEVLNGYATSRRPKPYISS